MLLCGRTRLLTAKNGGFWPGQVLLWLFQLSGSPAPSSTPRSPSPVCCGDGDLYTGDLYAAVTVGDLYTGDLYAVVTGTFKGHRHHSIKVTGIKVTVTAA